MVIIGNRNVWKAQKKIVQTEVLKKVENVLIRNGGPTSELQSKQAKGIYIMCFFKPQECFLLY